MPRAKPGRPRKKLAPMKVDYTPPRKPDKMTASQIREWNELIHNPLIGRVDDSLLYDYIEMVGVRDVALDDLKVNGMTVPGTRGVEKTNPSWKIYRDCQDHLLKLRQVMMLTPKSRAELRASGLLEEAPPVHDDIETD
jgi:P27 family predicted phage terminase small subunit